MRLNKIDRNCVNSIHKSRVEIDIRHHDHSSGHAQQMLCDKAILLRELTLWICTQQERRQAANISKNVGTDIGSERW